MSRKITRAVDKYLLFIPLLLFVRVLSKIFASWHMIMIIHQEKRERKENEEDDDDFFNRKFADGGFQLNRRFTKLNKQTEEEAAADDDDSR